MDCASFSQSGVSNQIEQLLLNTPGISKTISNVVCAIFESEICAILCYRPVISVYYDYWSLCITWRSVL